MPTCHHGYTDRHGRTHSLDKSRIAVACAINPVDVSRPSSGAPTRTRYNCDRRSGPNVYSTQTLTVLQHILPG